MRPAAAPNVSPKVTLHDKEKEKRARRAKDHVPWLVRKLGLKLRATRHAQQQRRVRLNK